MEGGEEAADPANVSIPKLPLSPKKI